MKQMTLIFISVLLSSKAIATPSPKKYEKETVIEFSSTSKFKISAGWSFDDSTKKLTSPEGDLFVYLVETKAEIDLEKQSLTEWRKIKPDFSFSVLQKVSPPAKDGWDKTMQVIYEVPAKENRTVLTAIKVFKGTAYILLLDSSNAGLSKRASQLQIVGDTWHPADLQKEDLSKNKLKKFTDQSKKEMDSFILQAMKELDIPGASVAIVQDGKEIYRKGFGIKKLGSNEKVTPQTLFMIGSTTKPLTTLMLSSLVEKQKIKWDTPIKTALPSFELHDPKVTSQFLIEHTACACTGMPRRDMEFVFGSLSKSAEDTMNQLHTMKPTTGFGTGLFLVEN
jgi:hypothetical protein